jgi:hypothetical protein
MTLAEHEAYAKDLLSSLAGDHSVTQVPEFVANPNQNRNAAKAMTAVIRNRLSQNSNQEPVLDANTTYEWNGGVFNSRNIADRDHVFTNLRRKVATALHWKSGQKPVAYLLACTSPNVRILSVWTIPEPVLFSCLPGLPTKEGRQEYTIQIHPDRQRFHQYAESPELSRYFREFPLSRGELRLLRNAREVDDSVRRERTKAKGKTDAGVDTDVRRLTKHLLAISERRLDERGVFDPKGIKDGESCPQSCDVVGSLLSGGVFSPATRAGVQ